MNFQYVKEADMLYFKLADGISTESEEVGPGIVVDYENNDKVIGIEIEDASTYVDLSRLEVSSLPIMSLIMNQERPLEA